MHCPSADCSSEGSASPGDWLDPGRTSFAALGEGYFMNASDSLTTSNVSTYSILVCPSAGLGMPRQLLSASVLRAPLTTFAVRAFHCLLAGKQEPQHDGTSEADQIRAHTTRRSVNLERHAHFSSMPQHQSHQQQQQVHDTGQASTTSPPHIAKATSAFSRVPWERCRQVAYPLVSQELGMMPCQYFA